MWKRTSSKWCWWENEHSKHWRHIHILHWHGVDIEGIRLQGLYMYEKFKSRAYTLLAFSPPLSHTHTRKHIFLFIVIVMVQNKALELKCWWASHFKAFKHKSVWNSASDRQWWIYTCVFVWYVKFTTFFYRGLC